MSLGIGTGGTATGTGGRESGGGGKAAGGAPAGGAPPTGGAGAEAGAGSDSGGSQSGGAEGGGSDTGGAASTGGGSASGGGSACAVSCTDSKMVDDFDDGDSVACPHSSWDSGWWIAADGTGTLSSPPGGDPVSLATSLSPSRGASCTGLHFAGSGFASWGANLGLTFNNPDDTVPRPVSLAGATGFHFWARGSGSLRLALSTTDVDPPENGGTCTESCKQYFKPAAFLSLSSDWQEFTVSFGSLYSETVSRTMSVEDLEKVLFIAFTAEGSGAFDLWLDDLSLVP